METLITLAIEIVAVADDPDRLRAPKRAVEPDGELEFGRRLNPC
jgi:hypothetical protein